MNEDFKAWHMEQYGFFTQMDSQIGDIVRERFAVFLAGQAAERKRCAEIAKKDIGEQCTCVVCRERRKIAKAIEGE